MWLVTHGFTTIAILSISAQHVLADVGFIHNYTAYQAGDYGTNPTQGYRSSSIPSPLFGVTEWNTPMIDKTPYIFTTLDFYFGDRHNVGPYIFNSADLSLVYGNPNFTASNNARVQPFKNTTLLTFWAGGDGIGHAPGGCLMMNDRYDLVYNVTTVGLNTAADLHECEITHDDTVLLTAYETVMHDLTSVGGTPSDRLLDSLFQEIDVETGRLLFSWRGSDHIAISKSFQPYEADTEHGWDAYHINSVQKTREGSYLVSLRHNNAIVLINGTDGSTSWQLGGRDNKFTDLSDGRATSMAWQHHARFIDDDESQLTVFDNHALEWEEPVGCADSSCSRGVRLQINYDKMTAEVKQEFWSPHGIGAYAMGSYDHLPDSSNTLIGWGSMASFSEYTQDGKCVMDVLFGVLDTWVRAYRFYKAEWKAFPRDPPAIAAPLERSTMFVSWNGATEVRSWAVMSSDNSTKLTLLNPQADSLHDLVDRVVPKVGFETAISVDRQDVFYRVAALDHAGVVLGVTDVLDFWLGTVQPATDNFVVGPDGERDRGSGAALVLTYSHKPAT